MKSLVESLENISERSLETYTKSEIIEELEAIIDEIKESDNNKWSVWVRQGRMEYDTSLNCEIDGERGNIIFEIRNR